MEQAEGTRLWEEFCRTGDSAAFELLYRAYRVQVMRYCRARVGDEEAAEEITDRLFAYLAVRKLPCSGSFEAMLIYYAGLRCANYRPPPRGQVVPELAGDGPGPSARMETTESHEQIARALWQLTDEEREVVLLRFFGELGFGEISRITGVARWTLSRRCRKALGKLRRILKKTQD